jgi:UPF0042 nucleotide-binding protein
MENLRFVIVTGLSGAGKSQAIRALEDMGYFCVDNLPPALLVKFAEICAQAEKKVSRVAVVIDARGAGFFGAMADDLGYLRQAKFPYEILFLEASNETLVRRFKETRRPHPLAGDGDLLEGIKAERETLKYLRNRASIVIDTSSLTPQQLREELRGAFTTSEPQGMTIRILSFGYKKGIPIDCDLVFDVRFLPNPFYIPELKPLPGTNPKVMEYIMSQPDTAEFLPKLINFVDYLLPHYEREGKSYLVIGIGCTGGQHRSVMVAEYLRQHLSGQNRRVFVEHRDCSI